MAPVLCLLSVFLEQTDKERDLENSENILFGYKILPLLWVSIS